MMVFNEATIDRFCGDLARRGISNATLRAYSSDLRQLLTWVGPDQPVQSPEQVNIFERACAEYMNVIRQQVSPATTKRRLASLRAFGNWLRIQSHGGPGFLAIYKAPKTAPGVAHPLPGGLDSILTMYSVCRSPQHQALVVLMGLMGLRVSEARAVKISDFDEAGGELGLNVRGKGDKGRRVPCLPGVSTLLDRALIEARNRPDGRLVPLADRSARAAWTRIGVRAGVGITASHDGRMTFGTTVYGKSKNLRATQELLGHSSSQTTEGYTGISEETKREAANIL